MKLIAKARISGPFGVRDAGEELTTDAKTGADLVERRIAEEVPAASTAKTEKASTEKA